MSTIADKVCIEALSLPKQVRAEIAHRLIASLEEDDYSEDVSEAWRVEIQRRREEVLNGKAKTVSAEEAMRQAYAAIGE
jgi:putative addiction module component (TIGR02574 family)